MQDKFLKWLRDQEEVELYPLLQDLLIAMGFQRVEITHGTSEGGRDLVFMERDRIGREVWRAIQYSRTRFSANFSSASHALRVLDQARTALHNPSPTSQGTAVTLEEVWIITPFAVGDEVKRQVPAFLNERQILVIDGPHLFDLFSQHLPHLAHSEGYSVQKYFDALIALCDTPDEFLTVRFNVKYSLADVFVQPRTVLQLLDPSSLGKSGTGSLRNLLSRLRKVELPRILTLVEKGLLPACELFDVMEAVAQLRVLEATIQRAKLGSSVYSNLGVLINRLTLAFNLDLRSPRMRASLKLDDLRAIEVQIAELDNALVAPLKAHRRIAERDRAYSRARHVKAMFGGGRNEEVSHEERTRQEQQRMQDTAAAGQHAKFFENLLGGYTAVTDRADPWASLSIAVSGLIAGTLPGVGSKAVQTASNILAAIKVVLDEYDRDLLALRREYNSRYQRITRELTEESSPADWTPELREDISKASNAAAFFGHFEAIPAEAVRYFDCDPFSAFDSFHRVVVSADMGMGKTTLLKRYARTLAERFEQKPHHVPFPVIVPLGALSVKSDGNLLEMFRQHAVLGVPEAFDRSGVNVRWILDGFDEVEADSVREAVLGWGDNENERYLLASRPTALPAYTNALRLLLQPFGTAEKAEYLRRLPWDRHDDAEELIAILEADEDLSEITDTPLLLTLVALLAKLHGPRDIPRRRELVFEQILRLMLCEWDRAKGFVRHRSISDEALALRILRSAAFVLYRDGRRTFSKEQFVDAVISGLPLKLPLPQVSDFFLDLLRDCVVIQISPGRYGFFHYSLQEFLAALELASDFKADRVWSAVEEYFRSGSRWEQVLLFFAGIRRDVTELVNDLHGHIAYPTQIDRRGETYSRLQRLLDGWLRVADFTRIDNLNPRGKVAEALAQMDFGGLIERWRKLATIR